MASQRDAGMDPQVLDGRLVACYRAAELLLRGGLAGDAPQQAMERAQELRGEVVAADELALPAIEVQVAALEAQLRGIDALLDDTTFQSGLSVVTRGGLLGYGRVLLGAPFESHRRADRFVLLTRWLLARDAGEGRLFLPPRQELAPLLEQLLVGLPGPAGDADGLATSLRAQRDQLLMTEDLETLLQGGLYREIHRARLDAAGSLSDPELLHALMAVEVDLHNFIEDCVGELQARTDGSHDVRAHVEQALAEQRSALVQGAPPAPASATPIAIEPQAPAAIVLEPEAGPGGAPQAAGIAAPIALPRAREVIAMPEPTPAPEPEPPAAAGPAPKLDLELVQAAFAEETQTLRDADKALRSHPMVLAEGKPTHTLGKLAAEPIAIAEQAPSRRLFEVDMEVGLNGRFLAFIGMILITLAAIANIVLDAVPPSKRLESVGGDDAHEISRFLAEGTIRGGSFSGVLEEDWKRLGQLARKEEATEMAEKLRLRAVYSAKLYRAEDTDADDPSVVIETTRVIQADP